MATKPITTKHKSRIARIVHEAASDAHLAGVMDKTTMRKFDVLCLAEVTGFLPREIQALREREKVSQAVLARYLNVTTGLISQWERGERRPSGPALTLLSLIKRKGLEVLAE
jgi:putative transcriptional regulator